MKIMILLFAMLLGFGLACKEALDSRKLIAVSHSSDTMKLHQYNAPQPQVTAAV